MTGAVLDANPHAVIFFVEGFSTEAVLAAGNQPLVDIVTTSFGAIGSLPVPGIETGTHQTVVVNNKIHTGAADNTPSPAVQDATAGPPWSIGIAGYAEEGDDQKAMSGSYPDIAADWTQVLPNHDDVDGYHEPRERPLRRPARPVSCPLSSSIRGEAVTWVQGLRAKTEAVCWLTVFGQKRNPNAGSEAGITNAVVRNALNLSVLVPVVLHVGPVGGHHARLAGRTVHASGVGRGEHVQHPADDRTSQRHADDAGPAGRRRVVHANQ